MNIAEIAKDDSILLDKIKSDLHQNISLTNNNSHLSQGAAVGSQGAMMEDLSS